jgi:hypothetical protein
MLTKSKFDKMSIALKSYCKKYLDARHGDLDESGTRLLINSFLSDVLGFETLVEIKTEYMIRGTYADYMVQIGGIRHFLVEVKASGLKLNDNHLRQTINYGANEGVEYALLTNGKCFHFYKILFNKPIESRLIFAVDLTQPSNFKNSLDFLQFLHRDSVTKSGFNMLWNRTTALQANNLAGMLYADPVVNFLKRTLNDKYKIKFSQDELEFAIGRLISEKVDMETVKPMKAKKKPKIAKLPAMEVVHSPTAEPSAS